MSVRQSKFFGPKGKATWFGPGIKHLGLNGRFLMKGFASFEKITPLRNERPGKLLTSRDQKAQIINISGLEITKSCQNNARRIWQQLPPGWKRRQLSSLSRWLGTWTGPFPHTGLGTTQRKGTWTRSGTTPRAWEGGTQGFSLKRLSPPLPPPPTSNIGLKLLWANSQQQQEPTAGQNSSPLHNVPVVK